MTEALIFANGSLGGLAMLPDPARFGLVIAADGGLRHALNAGLTPNVVVGDLDSAPSELLQLAERRGAEVIRHPVDKDKTDLELALDLAVERGYRGIVVVGALGGRIDHEMANVLLLASPRYRDVNIRLEGAPDSGGSSPRASPDYDIRLVTDGASVDGEPGDILSLLPFAVEAQGVTLSGLRYPLVDGTLEQGSTRGMSNVMIEPVASVAVRSGTLLLIHLPASGLDR